MLARRIHTSNLKEIIKFIRDIVRLIFLSFIDYVAVKRNIERIDNTLLLIRVDAIGDYVLFRNFIEILRKSHEYRNFKITLCGNEEWKELAEKFDSKFVDEFIWINRDKFIRDIVYRSMLIRHISEKGFDVAIQPTFSRDIFWGDAVIRASNAKERIGSKGNFSNIFKPLKKISDKYYTKLIPASSGTIFEFNRNKEFFSHILHGDIEINKPYLDMSGIVYKFVPDNPYIVVFPNASINFKRWSPSNYAKLIKHIWERYALTVVLAGGKGDVSFSKLIMRYCNITSVIDVTGKITLSELAKLISESVLLISNETCAVHIGVAVNKKVVCLSNVNHFGRFHPYPPEIYNDILYIYPEEIGEKINDFLCMCNEYGNVYSTQVNINTISITTVQEIVDRALYAGRSSIVTMGQLG